MAEFLGIGMSHFPRLLGPDEMMANSLKAIVNDPAYPDDLKDPAAWPEDMRAELSGDGGTAAAERHRARIIEQFRLLRSALDRFQPDVCIIWGDDQYENFQRDIIPPFCVLAYEQIATKPWEKFARFGANVWQEPADTTFTTVGDRATAKLLTGGLIRSGFDISYAYDPLHWDGLSHAFMNAIMFLDYDRTGFGYPVIPFPINCYGRRIVCQRGGLPRFATPVRDEDLDPPSPTPGRCFDLGAACVRVLAHTDKRVAFIASGSFSHAFLSPSTHFLYPNLDADRVLFTALREGDFDVWSKYPLESLEAAGQHEVLAWMCLMGAMQEAGGQVRHTDFVESYIFNSAKGFAVFEA